jgi:hypothetical protein
MRILAEAPALTGPTGTIYLPKLSTKKNINMPKCYLSSFCICTFDYVLPAVRALQALNRAVLQPCAWRGVFNQWNKIHTQQQ